MNLAERDDPDDRPAADSPRPDPALADAAALVARAEADEASAADARERFRHEPMPAQQPDDTMRPLLEAGEVVHTARSAAILNTTTGASPLPGYGGTLYLTNRRLVHVGRVVVSIDLEQIRELSLAGERLLLTFDGGEGISLDLDRPRLLRVEIAAARAAAKARSSNQRP